MRVKIYCPPPNFPFTLQYMIDKGHLSQIKFLARQKGDHSKNCASVNENLPAESLQLENSLVNALNQYFSSNDLNHSDCLADFNLLTTFSTKFQQRVINQLCKTHKGEFLSYKSLGMLIGSRAYQAIGNVLKNNPFPLLIPCHRVIPHKTHLMLQKGINPSSVDFGGFIGENSASSLGVSIKISLARFELRSKKLNM